MPLGRQGPQKCSICDKAFSNASALTKHKLTHSDERRHACATCGKAFKRQDHLNGHMLNHRNKKPFECKSKGCGKSYCDARSLRRHVENRHGHEVLESMNLASHKHTSKKHKSHGKLHQEPQQEVVQFASIPIKLEYSEGKGGEEEALEAKPQIQIQVAVAEHKKEKSLEEVAPIPAPPPPPVEKGSCGESANMPTFSLPRKGVPIVVKRENISVFDFDESMEDSMAQPYNAVGGPTFPPTSVAPPPPPPPSSASTLDKVAPPPPVLKINGFGDPTKLGQIPDIKLIQEWARRLGDSKVALFVSSGPANGGGSSITQFSGPLQIAGGNVTTSGPSHAFIPTSENGIFSVTPISIVPTSSNEFSVKRADIFMTSDPSGDSSKPFYILPPQQLISSSASQPPPPPPVPTPISASSNDQPPKITTNESKTKPSEPTKGKEKSSGIGSVLVNRIKTKLKASNLKKLGKAQESKLEGGYPHHPPKHHSQNNKRPSPPVSTSNDIPVLSEGGCGGGGGGELDTHGDLMLLPPQSGMQQSEAGSGSHCPSMDSSMNGGLGVWCDSPKDCLMHAMEEDRLSDGGAEGDDKPVECSICCRRFKNTPALNGHMRLHGGYFKKETEGNKKKEVSKDNNHGTPLQTVSVSVRALIEEKIRERRNNLLKLAAAAAEKAANEQGGGAVPPTESTTSSPSHDKPKLEKGLKSSENKKATSSSTAQTANIAQPQPQPPLQDSSPASNSHNQKQNQNQAKQLNPNPELITSEKDRNCDHLINDNNCRSNSSKLAKANCKPVPLVNNMNGTVGAGASVNLDGNGSFIQDPSNLLMGTGIGNAMNIGVQQGSTSLPNTDGLLQSQSQLIPSATHNAPELTHFPFQVLERSNFSSLLDCGLSPDQQSCPAFQIIYVDANGESIPLAVSQGGLGKASEFLPVPVSVPSSKMCSMPNLGSFCDGGADQSSLKGVKDALMGCPAPGQCLEDPCTPLWEWKSSGSSDNTDNSFGIPQDFFGSSSSDTQMESKDPVAAGRGYCYTPILSPNSSFCLTPGPDSLFEVSNQNPSLSFLCPSPGLGDGPIFSYSNVPSLANPPSEEQIFSPDPPTSQPTPTTPMNISSPLAEQQKCFQYQPQQQQQQPQVHSLPQPKLQSSVFIDEFGTTTSQCQQPKDGGMSQNTPIQQSTFMAEQPQPPQLKPETNLVDSLPPITTFPTMVNNTTALAENSFIGSNLIYQCPIDSILGSNLMQQQQTFIPFEVFTSSPIPSSVTDKWVRGNTGKPKKIHVGKDYQADIPQRIEPPKGKGRRGRSMDEKLWDPNVMHSCSIEEVDNYLEFACCSAVPGGGMNKEYALHLLMLCKGNIREAILRLMEKLPTLPPKLKSYSYTECQRWSSEEIISFQISLFQVGKDFPRISKSIGTKCSEEVVSFYYFWKKVCPSQYHVMKQIWKGRLEHQQLQLQQNSNLLDMISNSNNNNNNSSSGTNGLANFGIGSSGCSGI